MHPSTYNFLIGELLRSTLGRRRNCFMFVYSKNCESSGNQSKQSGTESYRSSNFIKLATFKVNGVQLVPRSGCLAPGWAPDFRLQDNRPGHFATLEVVDLANFPGHLVEEKRALKRHTLSVGCKMIRFCSRLPVDCRRDEKHRSGQGGPNYNG